MKLNELICSFTHANYKYEIWSTNTSTLLMRSVKVNGGLVTWLSNFETTNAYEHYRLQLMEANDAKDK